MKEFLIEWAKTMVGVGIFVIITALIVAATIGLIALGLAIPGWSAAALFLFGTALIANEAVSR